MIHHSDGIKNNVLSVPGIAEDSLLKNKVCWKEREFVREKQREQEGGELAKLEAIGCEILAKREKAESIDGEKERRKEGKIKRDRKKSIGEEDWHLEDNKSKSDEELRERKTKLGWFSTLLLSCAGKPAYRKHSIASTRTSTIVSL